MFSLYPYKPYHVNNKYTN